MDYVLLVICYLPFLCMAVLRSAAERTALMACLLDYGYSLLLLNSLLNPFVYCLRLPEIRTEVVKQLRKLFCRSSSGQWTEDKDWKCARIPLATPKRVRFVDLNTIHSLNSASQQICFREQYNVGLFWVGWTVTCKRSSIRCRVNYSVFSPFAFFAFATWSMYWVDSVLTKLLYCRAETVKKSLGLPGKWTAKHTRKDLYWCFFVIWSAFLQSKRNFGRVIWTFWIGRLIYADVTLLPRAGNPCG